jgi:hypothetical protein
MRKYTYQISTNLSILKISNYAISATRSSSRDAVVPLGFLVSKIKRKGPAKPLARPKHKPVTSRN